jgi:hypothetical protein
MQHPDGREPSLSEAIDALRTLLTDRLTDALRAGDEVLFAEAVTLVRHGAHIPEIALAALELAAEDLRARVQMKDDLSDQHHSGHGATLVAFYNALLELVRAHGYYWENGRFLLPTAEVGAV